MATRVVTEDGVRACVRTADQIPLLGFGVWQIPNRPELPLCAAQRELAQDSICPEGLDQLSKTLL